MYVESVRHWQAWHTVHIQSLEPSSNCCLSTKEERSISHSVNAV